MTAPSKPVMPFGHVQVVVWDGRVFQTSAQLRKYFDGKGISYSRWAAVHPDAFDFDKVRAPVAPTTVAHTASGKSPGSGGRDLISASAKQARAAGRAVVHGSLGASVPWARVTVLLLYLISAMILVSALVPSRIAPALIQRLYVESDRRAAALAAATASLLGLLVSYYMT